MVMALDTPVWAGVAAVGVAVLITAVAAAGTMPGGVAAAAAVAAGSMFRPRPRLRRPVVAAAMAMAAAGAEVMAAGTAAGNQTLVAAAIGLWPKANTRAAGGAVAVI